VSNPIPFNPDTMTVSQLKECAETLRMAFDGIARGVDAENIVHNLEQARDYQLSKYQAAGELR
jgi:hypothetical protein